VCSQTCMAWPCMSAGCWSPKMGTTHAQHTPCHTRAAWDGRQGPQDGKCLKHTNKRSPVKVVSESNKCHMNTHITSNFLLSLLEVDILLACPWFAITVPTHTPATQRPRVASAWHAPWRVCQAWKPVEVVPEPIMNSVKVVSEGNKWYMHAKSGPCRNYNTSHTTSSTHMCEGHPGPYVGNREGLPHWVHKSPR
jgi:hypothetical protein